MSVVCAREERERERAGVLWNASMYVQHTLYDTHLT